MMRGFNWRAARVRERGVMSAVYGRPFSACPGCSIVIIRCTMHMDHTIVPAIDKKASAEFFADIFGLAVKLGHFAEVQVNSSLTLAFADSAEAWGGPGFDP